jgi:capsular polysaccharide transport system ATP-binding protein
VVRMENVWKTYNVQGHRTTVARGINVTFPDGITVGLLGRNGSGKSSMLRLIAGSMDPDRGRVVSSGTISWPVGFAGSFHPELTGAQNIRFIARVYGVDSEELIDFVRDFAKLGRHFHLPIKNYSSGMRSRLAFGTSMGIHFDTYLVDEATSVGDKDFKFAARQLFLDRMKRSQGIVITHSSRMVRDLCTAGAVLDRGKVVYYDDIEDAIAHHEWNLANLERE